MQFCPNSCLMLSTVSEGASMDKEIYLFIFNSQTEADFWLDKTIQKFVNSIVAAKRDQCYIEFEDSRYYFWGSHRVSSIVHEATIYGPEELYIILDDPKRKQLETYERSRMHHDEVSD